MFFRGQQPEASIWRRFRVSPDGFTFVQEEDLYTDACVPHTVPNSPFSTTADNPDIPEIDGIPCTGRNSGQCIGLAEDAAPSVTPESTVGSDPTITGSEG